MNAACTLLLVLSAADPAAGADPPRWKTSAAFDAELSATIPAAVWRKAEVRSLVRNLIEDRGVAILLDQRIDPNRELSLEAQRRPVLDVLRSVAERVDAKVSIAGNTAYIGPAPAADRLRTLIELRTAELRQLTLHLTRERRLALGERTTLRWADLDEPAAILKELAERYHLQITPSDAIPHDLWAGATLPGASLTEALSLLLIQFDLTFRWTGAAEGVEIVPIPEQVVIEKSYRPRQIAPDEAVRRWTREFSGLHAEARGSTVIVRGRVEQHEAIEFALSGRRPGVRRGDPSGTEPLPIERRTFTIHQTVTAGALIETLEKTGIRVEYDPDALRAAGTDMNRKLELSLSKAGAAEFFRAWCRPLGLDYEIEGRTVRLRPR